MTTQADVPSKPRRLITPFRILITLVIIGLVLWRLDFFKRTPNFAIITSGDTPYWDQIEAGAKKGADLYGVNVTIIRCKPDMLVQNQKIKDAAIQKYDGVAVSPVDPISEASSLATIAATTNLVTLDSDSPVARRVCFIGSDNYDAGRLCGQIVRSAVPDGGEIIFCLSNAEKENTQRRRQGAIDELLQRSFDPERSVDPFDTPIKGDKFTIVATLVDGGDSAVATKLATDAIKDHPEVKCLVGLQFSTAPALVSAVEQSGQKGKIQIVGFDTSAATVDGINSGAIAGTVMQDQFDIGLETVHILADCARGDTLQLPVFAKRTMPCKIINKANIADIQPPTPQPQATTQPS